jgi:hypothetical protein
MTIDDICKSLLKKKILNKIKACEIDWYDLGVCFNCTFIEQAQLICSLLGESGNKSQYKNR